MRLFNVALSFHHTAHTVRESRGSGMLTQQHPHTAVQQEFTAILFQWKTKQNLYALKMTTHFFILVPNFLCAVVNRKCRHYVNILKYFVNILLPSEVNVYTVIILMVWSLYTLFTILLYSLQREDRNQ